MQISRLAAVAALLFACGGAAQNKSDVVSLPQQTGGGGPGTNVSLAQPTYKDESKAAVPIGSNDATWGSRTALVTIVEFSDFQCPFCSRAVETVAQLEKDYGEQQLRIVFKHDPLPFHPEAKPAAEAAETVRSLGGNQAFWTFYDLAFHDQASLGANAYEAWARSAGVSTPAFREAMSSHRFLPKVEADLELVKSLGVNGTPHFYINGVQLTGAQPLDKFKTIIDAQLAAAKDKLAKGTPAEDLYLTLANENFKKQQDDDDVHEDTKTVFKVPVGTSPQLGPKTALVTIIEFSDFQCPYCKRALPTLQLLRTTYGNDVRLVFKHEPLPFHPRAEPAAQLALEARAEKGDAGFWAAHDKLYDAQPHLDDADLDKVATDLKLDLGKVRAAISTHKYSKTLDDDQNVGDDFQASGTPHFFINGRRLVGAQPFERFKAIIDEEIAKAKALVAAGTKPESVYDELTKSGKTPPPPEQKTVVLTGTAPVKGPATAQVTIVEFSDFQCPFCKRAEDSIAEVLKAYPTKVKLVWRQFPLKMHAQAELAAEASVEAYKQKGNDGFWKMHDALYAHQTDQDGLERASIDGYAKTMGLDMAKFRHALDTGANASSVDADAKSGENAGVSGTPAFFIGTGNATGSWTAYSLSGAQPAAKFKKLIELALAAHP